MSQRGKTTVRGHALQYEGRACVPYEGWDTALCHVYRLTHKGDGMAYCECGAVSPTLPTTAACQRWHREVHKPEVRARQP